MSSEVYLAAPVRTAIGGFNGAFADVPATALGSAVIRATIDRAGIPEALIDDVIFGNVLSAGLGQNPARQASIGAGLSANIGATTVNKVCGSGLKAVMLAAQAVRAQEASLIVAGGMENMTRAPFLLEKARSGYRFGNGELVDSLTRDGLFDAYDQRAMGCLGDLCAAEQGISRQTQDDYAVESHQRARLAITEGFFVDEIVAVPAPGKETVWVRDDEQPRRIDEEKLRRLRPAFGVNGTVTAGNASSINGTVTAGNASSINDGAAAVCVLSGSMCRRLDMRPDVRVLGYSSYSREPERFTLAPIDAIGRLLESLPLAVADVDLFEINEAFAVVPIAAMRAHGIPREKVNVHGGAIALGHPLGASGTRTLVTLIHAMRRRQAKIGIVTLCIGGGEAVAMAVELLEA